MRIPACLVGAMIGAFSVVLRAEDAGVVFRPLSFTAATDAAAAEHKLVFIDFFTTWCGPCKLLDERTWTDPAVAKLLAEKTVALRLDAEKEGRELAARYHVDAYPTLVLLKPDGTQVERLIGFREPVVFIREFNEALAGRTSLQRTRAAAESADPRGPAEKVKARHALARELLRNGRFAEALVEYLWLYDHAVEEDPSFAEVRTGILTREMSGLARSHPPAVEALGRRRDAAKARLLGPTKSAEAATEMAALNEALGESYSTFTVFDQLPQGDPRRRWFGLGMFRQLLKERRYQEALEVQPYEAMLDLFNREIAQMETAPQAAKSYLRDQAVMTAAFNLGALAAAGETDPTRALRDRILAVDASVRTKELLRDRLRHVGRAELAEEIR